MKDGNYTIYLVQGSRIEETPHGKPDASLVKLKVPWSYSSGYSGFAHCLDPWEGKGNDYKPKFRDSYENRHQTWADTGYYGWTELKYAKEALKRCREENTKKGFEDRDGYNRLTARAKYEFRIVKFVLSKESFILKEEEFEKL